MGESMSATLFAILLLVTCCVCRVSSRFGEEIDLISYEIFVDIEDGESISLLVEPDDDVLDLRAKIGVAVSWQSKELRFGDTLLDNYSKLLSDYNICPGSRITMTFKDSDLGQGLARLNVTTTLNGQTIQVQTRLDSTVASLKDDITKQTGIPQAKQRLLLRGKELKSERRLWQYSISNKTELKLGMPLEDCQRMGRVTLKTLSGAVINMEINLFDTVANFKARIQDVTGVAIIAQNLFIKEVELFDLSNHLCDYGAGDGTSILLVLYSSKIRKAHHVAQLKPVPTKPIPDYQSPIFREANNTLLPDNGAIYLDTRNWALEGWDANTILPLMTPTAYLDPDPDRDLPVPKENLSQSELSDEEVVCKIKFDARVLLASSIKSYRTPLKCRSAWNYDERAGIRVGYGVTRGPLQEPLAADINNYAPDRFTDADLMRLFEVSERVRQLLDEGSKIGHSMLSIERQREINMNVLYAYLEALAGFPREIGFDKSELAVGEEDCPICRDNLTVEPWVRLPCEHTFHIQCMLEWTRKRSSWNTFSKCIYCQKEFARAYDVVGKTELESID